MRLLLKIQGRVARESDVKRHKHGAIIISKSGRLIASGSNVRLNDPSGLRFSIHAEELALSRAVRKAGADRAETIICARFNSDGTYGLSRPCPRCDKLIREAGIKEIIHT